MGAIKSLISIQVLLPDLLCQVLNIFRGGRFVDGATLADAIKL